MIAAIEGYCLGGGMELAAHADLRVASDTATFGQPERTIGTLPGWGAIDRLETLIGGSRAREIVLTGREYTAATMAQWGFVNETDAEPQTLARQWAEDLATGAPLALGAIKRVFEAENARRDEQSVTAFGELLQTTDFREGVAAVRADREPHFDGE